MTSARPGSVAWWQQRYQAAERATRPRADGLRLERILDVALDMIDTDGLDAVTMRRLAARLETAHTSLYRHVASRDELLVLCVDRMLGELRLDDIPVDRDPRRQAEALLRRYRQVLLAHPALAPLLTTAQMLGPNALAGREVGLAILDDAGVPPDLAARAYLTLTHYVIGSAVLEANGAARGDPGRQAMQAMFGALDPNRYPVLVAHATHLNLLDPDQEFEFGLATLLDGITATVNATATS
jgi:AcrR family transcriptional regulator